jgi:hypothetical protein
VTDNGIGRIAASNAGSKSSQSHKSIGIHITRERLALINGELDTNKVVFNIEDLTDNNGQAAGTKVNISIRFQQNYKAPEPSIPIFKNEKI